MRRALVIGMIAGGLAAGATFVPAADVIPAREASRVVSVSVVAADDASVDGRLVNHGGRVLRDVRLLVEHTFAWTDDYHPGPDNPSRAAVVVIPGPIPPHGSVVFSHPVHPALPARGDGTFRTEVTVLGFTEIG